MLDQTLTTRWIPRERDKLRQALEAAGDRDIRIGGGAHLKYRVKQKA